MTQRYTHTHTHTHTHTLKKILQGLSLSCLSCLLSATHCLPPDGLWVLVDAILFPAFVAVFFLEGPPHLTDLLTGWLLLTNSHSLAAIVAGKLPQPHVD
jgi:hypothetical protein